MSTSALHPTQQVNQARRGLLVFGLLLVPFSLLGYWFYAVTKESAPLNLPSLPLMWAPGMASVIARLALREGFADVSFRQGRGRRGRAILLGFALPLAVGALAYGAAFAAGLVEFAPPRLPFASASGSPLVRFAPVLVLAATLGTLLLLPGAAGEEIGWRGYLVPRLIAAGAPWPLGLSGLLWGAWHLAPLLASGYAAGPSPWLSAVTLLAASLSFGFILAGMRIDSGSIWPGVIAHAAWNAVINGGFDLAVQGESARLWVGESGLLVVSALAGAALLIGRRRRAADCARPV